MEILNFLLLEDNEEDAAHIVKTLERSGMSFEFTVVNDRAAYKKAITETRFDAIMADNALPQFSAREALSINKDTNTDIPVILVTGSVSEEFAVEIMKEGVSDYILKDRLQRLPSALHNAINKATIERERKKYYDEVVANEALLTEAEKLAHYGSWETDLVNYKDRWSDEQYRILGYEPGAISPSLDNLIKSVYHEDREHIKKEIFDIIKSRCHGKFEFRVEDKNGGIKYISAAMAVKTDLNGHPYQINGFTRDISEFRNVENKEQKITADLIQRNKDLEQFAFIVSHNLRSPVANIVGISEVMNNCALDETEKSDFMDSLTVSVKILDSVIIDLNEILQIRNHINENKEQVRFTDVIDNIKISIQDLLESQQAKIICDFTEVNEICSLRSFIYSIFYNLVSNSLKFRRPNVPPVIEIKSRKSKNKIELIFTDNCIGIDLQKKNDQIFGLYKRFHPEYATGKGMGLFMVKTQVESLGGKIFVQSKVNEGTVFRIELEQQNAAD